MRISTLDRLVERLVSRWFFYGWAVVSVTFVTAMITAGIGGYGLSFFIIPMSEELGVSRTEFSAISAFRLVLLPVIPLLGMLVDKKHGPRIMIVVGSIVAGIALMWTSKISTIWQFYIIYGIVFGFAMNAMGGMLVGPAVISKWFIRQRGRAMAVGTMGISAGGVVIAPLAGWVIGQHGWRTGWVVLGLILLLIVTPVAGLLMRRSPEDVGMQPDGDPELSDSLATGTKSALSEYSFTLKQAIRTRELWMMVAIQSIMLMSLSPVLFHQVAYFLDKGIDLKTATSLATTLAFFAVVAKIPWGYFSEKVNVRWVMSLCLILSGLSLFIVVWADSLRMLYIYAALHGLTMGGAPTVMNVAWAVYFGRRHMGTIRGFVTPVGNIIGAFSPIYAGWAWSTETSYDMPFAVFAFAWIFGGIVSLATKTPTRPNSTNLKPRQDKPATT
jgi:MFS family permease